jgi:hypothetical protein
MQRVPLQLGLAFRVHAQRGVLAANALPIAAALSLAIPGGLLIAAGLGRLAGLPAVGLCTLNQVDP